VTVDLARERRIRGNLAELRRLLEGNPRRAERVSVWLAEQEAEEMSEKPTTLRLPQDLLDQADRLARVIGSTGDFATVRVTRSSVIRLALLRGFDALREEFGVEGTKAKKSKRSGGRSK